MTNKSNVKYEKLKKGFFIKIMKIYSILFVIGLFSSLSATTLKSQNSNKTNTNITISLSNASLKTLLSEIEAATDYSFMFGRGLIDNLKVSIEVKDKSLEEVLEEALSTHNLSYVVKDKQIIIVEDKNTQNQENKGIRQASSSYKLKGVVVDEKNETLVGVSVSIKGTTTGVMTDIDGNFSLDVIPGYTLEVRYMGYKTQEILIVNQKELKIRMEDDVTMLKDVVVVGWGKQKKESVVGAVQTIKPEELRVPSSNLSNALGGRLAGVISVQRTGEPGADASNFWIRGISSFSGGTSPLIFIDNIEASAGDLNALPPEAIEGFSILKDAAATALYGARGANGVMLVTTKNGSDMAKPKVNFRLTQTFSAPTKLVDIADGVDYMRMYNEAGATRYGSEPFFSDDKIQGTIEKRDKYIYPNINWIDFLFKDYSMNQSANINITGGAKRVDYFASATVTNDNGMLKKDDFNNFDNNIQSLRYSFQANVNAYISSSTKVGVRVNSIILDYNGPNTSTSNIYSRLFQSPGVYFYPVLPAQKGENHILFGNAASGPLGNNRFYNPYADMVSGYNNRNESTVTASFNLEQKLDFILPGLKFSGLASFKNWSKSEFKKYFDPFYYRITDYTAIGDGKYGFEYDVQVPGVESLKAKNSSNGDRYINLQGVIDYAHKFGNHDVTAMLVYMQRDFRQTYVDENNFISTLPNRNQGIAGRLTYGYDNRYLMEFNFGYNGSENFEKGDRFGFFPSIALGYVVSNEKYFEPLLNTVNHLKLRGSYGTVGNSSIAGTRFPYLTEVDLGGWGYGFGGGTTYQYVSGAKITKYGLPGAHWEVATKLNLGIDLRLLNCLDLTVDYFHEKRKDIFLQRKTIPDEIGLGTSGQMPWSNFGQVKNQGVDLTLDFHKQVNDDFLISAKGTFTYAHNKILAYDDPDYDWAYLYQTGRPIGLEKGYIALGLFESEEDIKLSPTQSFEPTVLPGDIKYKDLNGDGKIDGNDQTFIGNPTSVPEIVYGLGISTQYKNWDASIFFQGAAGTSIQMKDMHPFGGDRNTVLQYIKDDYWSVDNPNPNAKYPRLDLNVNNNNSQISTFWNKDGSFLRLKNIEFGYTYKFARIYISGQNLLTFSEFKYWDPELGSGSGLKYPTQRSASIGIQVTL